MIDLADRIENIIYDILCGNVSLKLGSRLGVRAGTPTAKSYWLNWEE